MRLSVPLLNVRYTIAVENAIAPLNVTFLLGSLYRQKPFTDDDRMCDPELSVLASRRNI